MNAKEVMHSQDLCFPTKCRKDALKNAEKLFSIFFTMPRCKTQ